MLRAYRVYAWPNPGSTLRMRLLPGNDEHHVAVCDADVGHLIDVDVPLGLMLLTSLAAN